MQLPTLSRDTVFFLLNLVFFQVLWFACVVGTGGMGWAFAAPLALLPLIALSAFSPHRRLDWQIAAICVGFGMVIDNIWVAAGILAYDHGNYAPYWIGVLWLGLGLTINHSMSWFRDRRVLGPLIVGAFAPVTYFTGQRFDAVAVEATYSLVLISVSWALLFVVLSSMAHSRLKTVEAQS